MRQTVKGSLAAVKIKAGGIQTKGDNSSDWNRAMWFYSSF